MIERAGSPGPGAPSWVRASMHACGPTPQLTPIASTPAAARAAHRHARASCRRRARGPRRRSSRRSPARPTPGAPRRRRAAGATGRRRSRSRAGRPRPRAGRRPAPGTRPGWPPRRDDAARASAARAGPMLPPTQASRPLTSRASRATCAARRLKRPASDGEAERVEAEPVGPERERLDQLRAGVEVLAVDRPDEIRAGRGELVEARALGDAAREQQRAHAAVREQRACGEARGEAFARGSLAGHRAQA